MTKCDFVIIGFNNPYVTENLISSFKKNVKKHRLFLYDNASSADISFLARKYKLGYYRSAANLGFSDGVNNAVRFVMKKSDSPFICVLNNDLVFDKFFEKSLDLAMRIADRNELAAFTPLLYQDENKRVPENFGVNYYRSGLAVQNRSDKSDKRALLNGACLFLRKSVCESLLKTDGYILQPFFFFNAEDVEFSLRLLDRGYQFEILSEIEVQHLGSTSLGKQSPKSVYFYWRNLTVTFLISRNAESLLHDLLFFIFGQLFMIGQSVILLRPWMVFQVYFFLIKNVRLILNAKSKYTYDKNSEVRKYIKNGIISFQR